MEIGVHLRASAVSFPAISTALILKKIFQQLFRGPRILYGRVAGRSRAQSQAKPQKSPEFPC